MATDEKQQEALSPGEYIELLEQTRAEILEGKSVWSRGRVDTQTKESIAENKRKSHLGGDGNHRFEGERYLHIDDKEVRRKQLRKLVDEGGQTTVGGPWPSHPELSRWHSVEFGLTYEEIDQLEKEDAPAETLVKLGWWYDLNRDSPWPVALASALPGEGAKRLPGAHEHFTKQIAETRVEYEKMGIKDIDRAVRLMIEHAPFGADAEHARFAEDVIREHVDTPELQEESRKAFILTMHRNQRGRV
jgi:pyrroloquinoline quinone (PQQ) biosynthesis protein C